MFLVCMKICNMQKIKMLLFLGFRLASDPLKEESWMSAPEIEMYVKVASDGRIWCSLCNREFTQKGHCKRHILAVHCTEQMAMTCGVCNNNFKNRDSLRTHERKAHGLYRPK